MPTSLQTETQDSDLNAVIALLPPKERDSAQSVLTNHDAESVQLLAHWLNRERQRKKERANRTAMSGFWLVILYWSAVSLADPSFRIPTALEWIGIALLALSPLAFFPTRLEKAAVETLLHQEDPQSIGPLLECLSIRVRSLRVKVAARLLQMLPYLTPAGFQQLSEKQQAVLHSQLDYISSAKELPLGLAVLNALKNSGGHGSIGTVYKIAIGDAPKTNDRTLREAARDCIDSLFARLEPPPMEDLPRSIDNIHRHDEYMNFQNYGSCILNLRQLLPQLTSLEYRSLLSETQRQSLYEVLMEQPGYGTGLHYGRRALHLEIVRTAERMGDTTAIPILLAFAHTAPVTADPETFNAVSQALRALVALVEREKMSKVLLRGASPPSLPSTEMLRAAMPAESTTPPTELLRSSISKQE